MSSVEESFDQFLEEYVISPSVGDSFDTFMGDLTGVVPTVDESIVEVDESVREVDESLLDSFDGVAGIDEYLEELGGRDVVTPVVMVDGGDGVASRSVSVVDSSVGLVGDEGRRTVRVDGRLDDAEARFYAQLGVGAWEREGVLDRLRKPVGGVESEAERDERVKKVLRGLRGEDGLKRGARLRFSEKDVMVLEFLAQCKYATANHVRLLFGVKEGTAYKRLAKLRDQGLVDSYDVFGPRPVWFLNKTGMELSGLDLPLFSAGNISYGMFPHQFVANHTMAGLIGGGLNVLNLDEWPVYNRVDVNGRVRQGDQVVSELQLQSSFGKIKVGGSDVYKPQLIALVEREFRLWREGGMVGPSPEFLSGNEWMWVLLPGKILNLAYHVPDLVVPRERGVDGEPMSIAIEVELSRKMGGAYERVLRAYSLDKVLYGKVVWVVRSGGPARELERVGLELGLIQEGRMDIVPILTDDGVFRGKDLWLL